MALAAPALATTAALPVNSNYQFSKDNINHQAGGEVPVNICHATSSATNPYVLITVDANSVKFEGHLAHAAFGNKITEPGNHDPSTIRKDVIQQFVAPDGHGGKELVTGIDYDGKGNKQSTHVDLVATLPAGCAPVAISTEATKTAVLGDKITDAATITPAGAVPGTVSFAVYAPGDTDCANPLRWPSGDMSSAAVPVQDGRAALPDKSGFPAASAGVYRWIATFTASDDSGIVVAGACNDPDEQTMVKAQPKITTSADDTVQLPTPEQGGEVVTLSVPSVTIKDTAKVTGGDHPSGKVTFQLYGPDDLACKTVIYSESAELSNGAATMATGYGATEPGVYLWVASYEGDARNLPAAGHCGETGETTVVLPADAPRISFGVVKDGPKSVDVGANIKYHVTVTNNSDVTATGVTVVDQLPAGTSFLRLAAKPAPSDSVQTPDWTAVDHHDGTVTFTLASLAGHASSTFYYVVDSDKATAAALNNTACVVSESVPVACDNHEVTLRQWDLGLTKTVDKSTASVGDTLTYTVTVTNYGPQRADHPVVTDTPVAGLTDVVITPAAGTTGWTKQSDTSWAYDGLLAVNSPQVFTVTGTVVKPAEGNVIDNGACVTKDQLLGEGVHADCDDAQTTLVTTPPPVNPPPVNPPPVNPPPVNPPPVTPPTDVVNPSTLTIVKGVSKTDAKVGDTLAYKIITTVAEGPNNGVARQDNVKIVDPLPQGITYVTDSAACTTTTKVDPPRKVTCSVTYDKGTRTVAAKADTWLQVGDTLELDFNATVDKDATKIHNVATASSDDVDAVQASADTSVTAVEGVIIEKPPVQQPGTVAPGTEAPGTVAQPATLPHTGADGSRLPLAGLALIGLGLAMVVGSRRRAAGEA